MRRKISEEKKGVSKTGRVEEEGDPNKETKRAAKGGECKRPSGIQIKRTGTMKV